MSSVDKSFFKNLKFKIKNFWQSYETKIILLIGFILVAGISFEAGVLKGQKWEQKPLIIEKPAESQVLSCDKPEESQNKAPETQNSAPESVKPAESINTPSTTCTFVGSKNSTKYHKPTCQFAKRIKPENQVCFKSEEEAKSRGYSPCSMCIK